MTAVFTLLRLLRSWVSTAAYLNYVQRKEYQSWQWKGDDEPSLSSQCSVTVSIGARVVVGDVFGVQVLLLDELWSKAWNTETSSNCTWKLVSSTMEPEAGIRITQLWLALKRFIWVSSEDTEMGNAVTGSASVYQMGPAPQWCWSSYRTNQCHAHTPKDRTCLAMTY